jgi:hypothetical protein
MDWRNNFSWGDWNNPGASRSQTFMGQFETNQTGAPVPSSSKSSYQNGSHQDRAYHAPPAEDALMEDIGIEFQSVVPNPVATAGNEIPRRGKHEDLDWKAQKNVIQSLYMDKDKTLKATIDIMKNIHSFDAR